MLDDLVIAIIEDLSTTLQVKSISWIFNVQLSIPYAHDYEYDYEDKPAGFVNGWHNAASSPGENLNPAMQLKAGALILSASEYRSYFRTP